MPAIMPRPLAYVFKRELLKIPFFGWSIGRLDMIHIDRSARARAFVKVVQQGRALLAKGTWVIMFPEGTRVERGQKGQYKNGGTRLAIEAGVPVVPIAVTSAKRSTSLPDVPTVAELGMKGFDVSTWYGVFAPAGTPAAVVTTLNTEINKLLATPDMKAAIQAQGAEAQAMTPAQLNTLLKNDYIKWKGIVEASGAKIE